MIGLNVSLCIKDIITGKVDEDAVTFIIAGTYTRNSQGLQALIDYYRDHYWYANPGEGERLCRKFFAEGKVFEPREFGHYDCPNIAEGHWVANFMNGKLVILDRSYF
jgi:hypothetical protein